MNRKRELIQRMAEIAMMAALAFVLDLIQGLITKVFPNGGSIGISMFPIMFLSIRRGFVDGFIAGLVMSLLQLIGNPPYVIPVSNAFMVFFQVALDYFLAYPLVALTALLRKPIINAKTKLSRGVYTSLACLLGGIGKFLAYFLSGFIFWGDTLPEDFVGGPVLFSLVYNGSYVLPSTILCIILVVILMLTYPKLFNLNKIEKHN